jgi:hypothetical protein
MALSIFILYVSVKYENSSPSLRTKSVTAVNNFNEQISHQCQSVHST